MKNTKRGAIFAIAFALLFILPFACVFLPGILKDRKKQDLMERGVTATATLLDHQRGNTIVNDIYELMLKVKVEADTIPAFQGITEEFIDPLDYYKLQPGLQIPALIDPEDPEDFVLLWEKAGIRVAF